MHRHTVEDIVRILEDNQNLSLKVPAHEREGLLKRVLAAIGDHKRVISLEPTKLVRATYVNRENPPQEIKDAIANSLKRQNMLVILTENDKDAIPNLVEQKIQYVLVEEE